MSKPDPPTPPNPIATAAAQTGTNVSTGVANAFLNNVNQNTPTGSQSYDVTGSYAWTDPSTGQTYNVPRFTNNQSQAIDTHQYLQDNPDVAAYAQAHGLNPGQFAQQHYQQYGQAEGRSPGGEAGIFDTTQQTRQAMASMGLSQANRASGILSTPFNPTGDPNAPGAGNAQNILNVGQAATSYDPGGQIQSQLGPYGDITNSYGPSDNFSADRQRVEDSLMARMNPQLDRERTNVEQRLADQGIRYGSQAYSSAMDDYNRQANDARFAAVGQAGSEQQRMTQEAQAQAQFQNQAQQQGYEQQLGSGTFANQAQAQQYQQNAALAAFGNQGLAQQLAQQQSGFNAENAQRNQWMQEQYAQRNQPLNEISALQSGSQVQNPNFVSTPGSQIATTDFAGITNANFQNQMGIYNSQNQNYQQLMGGLLGLGAGAIKSDRDTKTNIDRIGTVLAASPEPAEPGTVFSDNSAKELPIYRYSYKDDPTATRRVGPMAQDVEKIDKKAVKTIGGVKHIYPQRVMGSILRAA